MIAKYIEVEESSVTLAVKTDNRVTVCTASFPLSAAAAERKVRPSPFEAEAA